MGHVHPIQALHIYIYIYIYGYYIYVHSLHLADFIYNIICIYRFGRVARYYPTIIPPPNDSSCPQLYADKLD